MTKITKDTVKKMAQLGNIEITEDEANSFALDIERTLAYIDQLKELDTDSIEPTYQVTGLKNVWRKDVIEKPSPSRDDLLQCAGNNILNSIDNFVKEIDNSQILMLPGGFSAGDEPDGSAKFMVAVLKNKKVKEAVENLLKRDGLILGICNGFQALIKSGLLPYGEIRELNETSPTLTFNTIDKHMSKIVQTKIITNNSPWLSDMKEGDIHSVAISHGEGRIIITEEQYKKLFENNQIATKYVDLEGNSTMDSQFNPNGSYYAIEGMLAYNGRIFGKMGHSERKGKNVYKNIYGNKEQNIFRNGIKFFK